MEVVYFSVPNLVQSNPIRSINSQVA